MRRRIFTVDQANELLPELEGAFAEIETHKDAIRREGRRIEVLDLLWGQGVLSQEHPDNKELLGHRRVVENEISEIERVIQEEFLRRGIRFPAGGIENGLLDFPSIYRGRRVYLCWRNGEPQLQYWHETDSGFRGRMPITEEHRRMMGLGAELIDDDE